MNEIKIEMRIGRTPYCMHDHDGNELTFPTAEHAVRYLKQEGFTDREIKNMSFIYTNESRECNCSLCEKRDDCHVQYKFQRLPRNPNGTGRLGMCPKL